MKALTPFDQKWQAAIRRFSFFGVSARITPSIERCGGCPNCWFWRYYLQVSSYTNFSNLQLGGKGQFLKASCHRGGPDKAALKGILWDSAAMNSRGSEIPTGPRK
jgi:hypothetical protein